MYTLSVSVDSEPDQAQDASIAANNSSLPHRKDNAPGPRKERQPEPSRPREHRDYRDQWDARDPRDGRNPRNFRDTRDQRDQRDPLEAYMDRGRRRDSDRDR